MKRSILIDGIDKELELSKVVMIKSDKQFIYLDQLRDGTWRLAYTRDTIDDISQVNGFEIIRED